MATDEKGPETRCNAGSVSDLIPHIPASMLQRMEELNLTSMTKLQLGELSYRKTCGDLRKKAIVHKDQNVIEIKITGGQSLWISPKVVQLILDMPRGSSKDFKCSFEDSTEEYNKMFKALRYVALKYPDQKTQKKMDAERAVHQANEGHQANGGHEAIEGHEVKHDLCPQRLTLRSCFKTVRRTMSVHMLMMICSLGYMLRRW